jgi:oligosaccharide repeat unit polymerase
LLANPIMETHLDNIKIKSLPYLRLFLIIFLLINLVGIINFPFYRETLKNDVLFFLVFLGFMGFTIGTLLIRTLKFKTPSIKGRFKPKLFRMIFIGVNLLSFLLIVMTHVMNRGILIIMGDKRYVTYAYTTLFIYCGLIITLLFVAQTLLDNKRLSKRLIFFVVLQSISVLSMGYRSPLIILVGGTLLIFIMIENDYQNKFKKVFTIRNILLFLGVLILMSSISSYRVSQKYDVRRFFRSMDFDFIDDHPYIMPIMPTLAVFRYDQDIVIKLIKKTRYKPLMGELAMSNFLTLLPGEQLGVRNIIGGIVDSRKFPDGRPWSITPTLQGALFVDGGFFGVFFGFFILAACIEYFKKIMVKRKDPFSTVLYAMFAINSLMLIHTGYFDVIFFLLIAVMVALRIVVMRIKF